MKILYIILIRIKIIIFTIDFIQEMHYVSSDYNVYNDYKYNNLFSDFIMAKI